MPAANASAQVAEWIVTTERAQVPPAALESAARACFDCVGVTIAGAADPVGFKMLDWALAQGAVGPSAVVATGRRTTPSLAALANGTAAHALEYDDTTGFGHPSAVIVPALLALAEATPRPISGADVTAAYVVGLEVGLAFFRGGAGRERYAQMRGAFHATGLFGRLAATAACARLRTLGRAETLAALGIAASTASGLVANFGTMTKPLHAGFAARDAVLAVELAAQGWTASPEVLESPVGFLRAVYGETAASADEIAASLGRPFVSSMALAWKRYPTCGFNGPAIQSVLRLMEENGIGLDDVEAAEVERATVSPEVLLYDWPRDGMEARFSVRYNVAAALAFGRVDLVAFDEACRQDSRLADAFARVRLVDGPPRDGDATVVRIRTTDGRTLEKATALRNVAGTAFNPMSDDEVRQKFVDNARRAFSAERAEEAADAWQDLAAVTDVREAMRTIC